MRPFLLMSLIFFSSQLTQAADIGAYAYPFKAVPNLTVNGKSGQVWLFPAQPFSVKVALDAGDQAGQIADWWVLGQIGNDFYTYDPIAKTWQAGKNPKLQMGLGSFSDYPLLENMALPSGNFALHFGVETPADGQWTTNNNRLSSTQITIPPIARQFVVSPQGNDANAGTLEQPWKTLKKAAATAQAGDLVLIRGGTYAEQLAPVNNCQPALKDQSLAGKSPPETLPIIFAAFPNEKPILNGSGISLTKVLQNARFNGLVHINGCHDIWIVGLTVQNSSEMGIYTYNSNRIKFIDNSTYNTKSSGIGAWYSRNVLIDGNEVNLANTGGQQENISIGENMQQFEIRYNHVHHGGKTAEGIDVKDGSSNGTVHHNHIHDIDSVCLYLDGWDQVSENIEFHSNRIHDCAPYNGISLAAEQGGTIRNIKVYNNIIYHVKQVGINIGAGYNHPAQNIFVYNNTIYETGYTNVEFGSAIMIGNSKATNVVIRNNIGASTDAQIINSAKMAAQIDHNLFIRTQGKYNNEVNGTDFIISDPLFVDPANGDFRLKRGSPAIGKGTTLTLPSFDLAGQPN
ncbi:MAG: hypothetical protein RIT27_904 [Pseudomonadota bacterium]|jgi:hypothetical protein